jgi:tetratricopeptide (TPR) repeat protein
LSSPRALSHQSVQSDRLPEGWIRPTLIPLRLYLKTLGLKMRAFLSHSSSDKALVNQVAEILGRAKVWYDLRNIETAADIRSALQAGLEGASVFVLFASQKALASDWVNFEVSFAEKQLVAGSLNRVAAFIIEDSLSAKDLPPLFHNVHVRKERSPKAIALDIQRVIQEAAGQASTKLFFGRTTELQELASAAAQDDPRAYTNAVLAFGLEGMGRRTLLRHFAKNTLGLTSTIEIKSASGDGLAEHLLILETELGVSGKRDTLQARLSQYQNEQEAALLERIVELVSAANSRFIFPIFVDEGGIIDEDGLPLKWVNDLCTHCQASQAHFGLVSRRNPVWFPSADAPRIPAVRLTELANADSRNLLTALFRSRKVPAEAKQVSDLTAHLTGYPPSAYYAAELAARDGIGQLLLNPSLLGKVTEARFLRALEADTHLNHVRQGVLRLLANYSPLPLSVIAQFLDLEAEHAHDTIQYLLDIGVVYPVGIRYKIAEPILRSVGRLYQVLTINHGKVAELLSDYLDEIDSESPDRLDLMRMYFRATQYSSGKPSREKSIQFASDTLEVAKQLYYAQEFERAVSVCERALEEQPNSQPIRDYLIRSYIQTERFEAAEREINVLERLGWARDASFLRGFLARRRHMHSDAIVHYQRSLRLGRRGAAVHRELAQCHLALGNLDDADIHIRVAEEADPENRYVLDLKCKIALQKRDQQSALSALAVLELIDKKEFFYHRKSVVFATFGRHLEALEA